MGKDSDQIRREIEDTRNRMGGTVDAIAYKADVPNRVKDSIHDRLDSVKSAVSGTASRMGSAITGATSKVGDAVGDSVGAVGDKLPHPGSVRDGAGRAFGLIKHNPIGLLLTGVAVGFIAGSLAPHTRFEDERLSGVSETLKGQMQTAGAQVMEHGKAVVSETMQAAGQSAREHGQQLSDETASAMTASKPGYG